MSRYNGQGWVPVDNVTCWIYTYSWHPDRPFTNSERAKFDRGFNVHAEVDHSYLPLRNLRNEYMIDRKVQKHDTFTGIVGVSEQDSTIQDSQGPIQDRTREHLRQPSAARLRGSHRLYSATGRGAALIRGHQRWASLVALQRSMNLK